MHYSDELIVTEIRKKNETVIKELYKVHFPMIVHLVCSNIGSEQEARDIYQEAVIAFYKKVQQPEFVLTCKIKTYLYEVCRRLWLKRLAQKKRLHIGIEMIESFPGVEDEMIDIEESEKRYQSMSKAMQTLGEPCLNIIQDYYLRNLSMEMISNKYGYTNADNAKNQKYKCLQRLKKLFFSEHNELKQ